MSDLQQPAAAPTALANQTEQNIQLQALVQHQALVTMQLVGAEGQLSTERAQMEGLTGKALVQSQEFVAQLQGSIKGMKADLDVTRSRIAELRGSQGLSATIAGSGIARDQQTIFMLKPAEFYSTAGFLLLFPLVLALARRIWRGGPVRKANGNSLDGSPQINRLEQAVEAIAIEVERIGEAQRFSAKLLAERPVKAQADRPAPPRSRRPVITPVP